MKATDHTDETYTMRQPEPALDITAHTEGSVTVSRVLYSEENTRSAFGIGATPGQVTIRPGPSGATGFPRSTKGNRRVTSAKSHRKRKARRKMQKASRRKNRKK